MKTSILITGAAGYIGSHALRVFIEKGYQVIALDDFSTGNRWAVPDSTPLFVGDFADEALLNKIHEEFKFSSVVHFAAKTSVEESVRKPELYREENFVKTERLARICVSLGVRNFIFSSTCAVYGQTKNAEVDESTSTHPESPYGATKLAAEDAIFSIFKAIPSLKVAALRYFNVAGASPDGEIGQVNDHVHSLVSICADVAVGKRNELVIHGTDYPTKDGTGVRDYIHVVDLATAHFDVLRYLENDGVNGVFNCGYGTPFSVREVVQAMEKVSGRKIPTREGPSRSGDIAAIFANSSKIRKETGWTPRFNDIGAICLSAYHWARKQR